MARRAKEIVATYEVSVTLPKSTTPERMEQYLREAILASDVQKEDLEINLIRKETTYG